MNIWLMPQNLKVKIQNQELWICFSAWLDAVYLRLITKIFYFEYQKSLLIIWLKQHILILSAYLPSFAINEQDISEWTVNVEITPWSNCS